MKLFSKVYGDDGENLVIVHGLFGMSDNWNTIGKKLSKYFRVHILDLRNHGKSPHSNNFNYEVMCQDLNEYIIDHDLVKPIILGHSLGGKLAIKFALMYSEKVKKIIVADIAPKKYNNSEQKYYLEQLNNLDLRNYEKRVEIDKVLSRTCSNKSIRLFLLKNLCRKKDGRFGWKFNLPTLMSKLDNIRNGFFDEKRITVPACFLKGERSDYILDKDKLLINNLFYNYRIVSISNAGHWLHVDNQSDFLKEVIKFCQENS